MDAVAVREMLVEDRHDWHSLVTLLETNPFERLHDPESPGWISRDVYTHLASWMEHSTNELEARLDGRAVLPLEGSDDEINVRFRARNSHMSHDEARSWAKRESDRRIEAIKAVRPERWDLILEAVARADGAQHYRAHYSYIAVS